MRSREFLAEGRHLGSRKHLTRHGVRSGNDLGRLRRARPARKTPGTHEAREATGVSELVVFQVSWAWMGCRGIGTKNPPRARRSAKRFGRRENARFSGADGCTLSGYTQGASPDDEPEAGEYGCSLKQSVGWQKSVERISITHRGKSQDEPTRRDLAETESSFRNTE